MRRLAPCFALLACLFAAASAAADGPSLTSPSGTITETAKKHFQAGVSYLQDPDGEKVESAYREFKTAYDLSGSAKILGNMGFCAMRLERDGEAIDAYSRYLREVPDIDADERAQIARDLQTLTIGVARMTLEATPAYAMITDERVPVRGAHVVNTYGPVLDRVELGVRPGHHIFTARLEGKEDAVWDIEVTSGDREHHLFTLADKAAPPAPIGPITKAPIVDEKPSSVGPIMLLATGGALLAGAAITGIVALSKTGDIEDRCPNDACPETFNLDAARGSARSFVTASDVMWISGAVVTLVGAYWGYRVWLAPKKKRVTGGISDWRLQL